jgi:valyl-tRNA synthetase
LLLLAPITPYVTDAIYRELFAAKEGKTYPFTGSPGLSRILACRG